MIKVGNTILSDDVATARFACDISCCGGACCVVGDAGAPVSTGELPVLRKAWKTLKGELSPEARDAVASDGLVQGSAEKGYELSCVDGGACVFVTRDGEGAARCAIQRAWQEGRFGWEKPISCHLFPVRLKRIADFDYANFEYVPRLCAAACEKGEAEGTWLSDFLEEPLVRRYGRDWYRDFQAACRERRESESKGLHGMIKTGQQMSQKQSQQQRLSPQQIQYIKLLQLPTIALEQRIKEEIELNPVLEEDTGELDEQTESLDEWEEKRREGEDDVDPVDQNEEIDWEEFMHNTEFDGHDYGGSWSGGSSANQSWRDLPNPYHESLLEELEQQVGLLDLDEDQRLIADQILGSLDQDGYFRREPEAVVDNIAFNEGVLTSIEDVEEVRRRIQRLDPPGIASRDLRDCLLVQLELSEDESEARDTAIAMLRDHWDAFEKKHFKKLKKKMDVDGEGLQKAFDVIKGLDPKPGGGGTAVDDTSNYIEPDFEVYYEPASEDEEGEGDFVITLNNSNVPPLTISPRYKKMWDDLKKKKKEDPQTKETKNFIKNKIESAQWFIDSIRQRQNTLMNTMKTIVALQEDFFKHGEGLKPMILKDIAERVNLDISTISRVVNGKYVQTNFGVFELKYFFSEGLETESGEEVSSREVKNAVQEIVDNENKLKPLSDQAIADLLKKQGYKVARRTVSKYREQLNIPVARLRKQIS